MPDPRPPGFFWHAPDAAGRYAGASRGEGEDVTDRGTPATQAGAAGADPRGGVLALLHGMDVITLNKARPAESTAEP